MSDGEFSEEELESLAVNLGSLHPTTHAQQAGQAAGSDTEADFLDKCDIKNRARAYNENDDKPSSGALLDHLRDSKTSKVRLF